MLVVVADRLELYLAVDALDVPGFTQDLLNCSQCVELLRQCLEVTGALVYRGEGRGLGHYTSR